MCAMPEKPARKTPFWKNCSRIRFRENCLEEMRPMKKLIQILTLSVLALTFIAVPAFAQDPAASPAAATQDDSEAKAALYKRYTDNYKTNQQVAYEAAKEYVAKYPNDDPKIVDYLKNFITKYEEGTQNQTFQKMLAEKKWAEAYPLGKQIAARKPDDLKTNLQTAWAGFQMALSGNNANNMDATNYTMKTIGLIESGKTIEANKPYADKDKNEDLGWLNYSLYLYNLKNNQRTEAANYLIKALQYENSLKSNPENYLLLAALYEAEFEKLRQQYTTTYQGKDVTPESTAALENVKLHLDPLMDAMARAIAYLGTDPKNQQKSNDLKEGLKGYYEFRNGSADGLDAMIAGIKSKPLPPPPTSAPAPTTTTTTMPPSNTASGTQTGATTPATTTPTTTTPTTTTPMPTPTPTTTTTPEKKPATTTPTTPGSKPPKR
jgi:hypothetical protein